jgi:hypothetical protein
MGSGPLEMTDRANALATVTAALSVMSGPRSSSRGPRDVIRRFDPTLLDRAILTRAAGFLCRLAHENNSTRGQHRDLRFHSYEIAQPISQLSKRIGEMIWFSARVSNLYHC